MTKIKKIVIVTTHSFGYIDFLVEKLNKIGSVDLTYINIDLIPFSYKNKSTRIVNSILKLLYFSGLKEKNRTNYIKNVLFKEELFDQILIIRPDKLEKEALLFLRKKAVQMTCFLFDGIENYKDQKKNLTYFDTVYSYDKKDVEKYKFEFLTNYIFDDEIQSNQIENIAFNISSFDERFSLLEKLAQYLKKNEISFRFIVKKDKFLKHENIEISNEYLPLNVVKQLISSSLVLVDLQMNKQVGLSFRIFEALGYKKKIITNNEDIVNYDFYNKNNIFVISEKNLEIPPSFFKTEYTEIDPQIIKKYSLTCWIFEVFKIESE